MKKKIIDSVRVANKLSKAVAVPTISYLDREKIDYEQLKRYHEVLKEQFPLIHEKLTLTKINDYSLLYFWQGTDTQMLPRLLMSHQDVVPVSESTLDQWKYPPFSGAIEEGYIWGRGTLDTKGTTIGCMEAVELLLEEGYEPKQSTYLAFGHDEEIQGLYGAKAIVEHLKKQDVRLDYVMDEGGIITQGAIAQIDGPIGLIGLGEKGYADIKVTVAGGGGHASMPPKTTAVGQIATLINRVESTPMKRSISPTVYNFLKKIGPHMSGVNKVIINNLGLFKPIFMKIFSQTPTGNALLGTTIAATMTEGSNATNVLPKEASVVFNCRIATNDSISGVVEHIRGLSKGMEAKIEVIQGQEPSKISPYDCEAYRRIEELASSIFKPLVMSPYLMLAASDSIKYEPICDHIYRFAPYKVHQKEVDTIHNVNERLSVENMAMCTQFYYELMKK